MALEKFDRAWSVRADEYRFANREHVRGGWFALVDGDHVVDVEEVGVDPGDVRNEQFLSDAGARGLEVQASIERNARDGIPMRLEDRSQLGGTFVVASSRDPHVETFADLEDITAIQRPGVLDRGKFAVIPQRPGDRFQFATTGGCTGPGDDRDLRKNDRRVLDEDAVGLLLVAIERHWGAPKRLQGCHVGLVLLPGTINVDRLSVEVGELTTRDRVADGADKREHFAGDCSIDAMTIDFRLDGRAAVVCGATGGIGRAIATAFAVAGASVTVVGRDESRIQAVIASLEGTGHEGLRADFTDTDDVAAAAAERAVRGPVHILVNNTGGPPAGKATEAHYDSFLEAFTMHMASAHVMVNAFAPGMKESSYGRIINVISTSVITPIEGLGVSNTIRGAMANWGRTLAVELGPFGITVNNLLPGFTKTGRLKTLFEGKAKRLDLTLEEVTANALTSIPAGRIGNPEELAAAALFLASPAGSYVNGVNFPVDGGRVCKG